MVIPPPHASLKCAATIAKGNLYFAGMQRHLVNNLRIAFHKISYGNFWVNSESFKEIHC